MSHNESKGSDYSDGLCNLPTEIIEKIVLLLPACDIVRLGQCCLRLREITRNETIWKSLVDRDYSIDIKRTENLEEKSARLFYLKILTRYGCMLSRLFYRKNFRYYGGLMNVVYYDWALYFLELYPPPFPDVFKNIQPQIICRLALDWSDENVKVLIEQETTDFGTVQSIKVTQHEADELLRIDIVSKPSSLPFMKDLTGDIAHWLEADNGIHVPTSTGTRCIEEHSELLGLSFNMAYVKFDNRVDFLNKGLQEFSSLDSLSNPEMPPFSPIKPGIFKGTYSAHGIEIISVEYQQSNENIILGKKVYGDRNVPCNELTFKGFLNKPMILTKNDQSSVHHIHEHMVRWDVADLQGKQNRHYKNSTCQPFILPPDCECDIPLNEEVFSNVLWRYQAECQISSDMYRSPEWIEGNLTIFSDDIFGVMFMAETYGFNALSIYHRVQENLSAVHFEDVFSGISPIEFSNKL